VEYWLGLFGRSELSFVTNVRKLKRQSVTRTGGHQSFSTSKDLNNAVGWVLHSALLVPYHSWRISHARHHAATGHCTRDEVFVPRTASDLGITKPEGGYDAHAESWMEKADDLLEDSPAYILARVIGQQLGTLRVQVSDERI